MAYIRTYKDLSNELFEIHYQMDQLLNDIEFIMTDEDDKLFQEALHYTFEAAEEFGNKTGEKYDED